MNKDLLDFVSTSRKLGVSEDKIKVDLLGAGWDPALVSEAMSGHAEAAAAASGADATSPASPGSVPAGSAPAGSSPVNPGQPASKPAFIKNIAAAFRPKYLMWAGAAIVVIIAAYF